MDFYTILNVPMDILTSHAANVGMIIVHLQ
jgi:hypothetical protein